MSNAHFISSTGTRRVQHLLSVWFCALMLMVYAVCTCYSCEKAAYTLYWNPGDITETQQQAEEEKLQAAFFWQFLQFIEFPAGAVQAALAGAAGVNAAAQEPFVIGVVGTSRVENFLTDIIRAKRLPDGRTPEIRHLTNLDDVSRCQAVFIAPSESARLPQILARTRGKCILTVGRDESFLLRGGLVNFYTENSRLRFEYNADEIAFSKLRFSSKLLRLGKQYIPKSRD
jgi:hypothetical protein